MAEPFYKKLESVQRTHWKNVDKYKIYTPTIGAGYNSHVYLAKGTNEKLAIKFYEQKWITTNKLILENELLNYSKLSTIGIINALVRKPLRTHTTIYLPLELSNCGSLDTYIKEGQSFPLKYIREVLEFLSGALFQLKDLHIIHNNIKPKHILVNVSENGDISYKLSGLKYCKDTTSNNAVNFYETSEYLAPEITAGFPYDYKADIWSIGATLYAMAMGNNPLKIDPTFLTRLTTGHRPVFNPNIPLDPALRELIYQCLSPDPEERPDPTDILDHPFTTGRSSIPAVVMRRRPQSEEELEEMMRNDFSNYMDLMNEERKYKVPLSCDKRMSMIPYIFMSSAAYGHSKFSQVYYCKHKINTKEYALKIIKTTRVPDLNISSLILDQLAIMVLLNSIIKSPFVVNIEDYFIYKNDLCIMFPRYNGNNLEKYIVTRNTSKRFLTLDEKTLLAYTILKGINEIHKRNITHKNLHPTSIFVTLDKNEAIKYAAIGGFLRIYPKDSSQIPYSSYKAPEVDLPNLEESNEFKPDIWSYGMILYLIIFEVPANEIESNKKAQSTGNVEFDAKTAGSFPNLVKMMKLCLDVDPSKRPTSDQLLKDQLFNKLNNDASP